MVLSLFSDSLIGVNRGLFMTIKTKEKTLASENTDNWLETEKMKSALSRMTDEDMQTLFDRAFADLQKSKLDSNHNQNDY